MLAPDFQFMLGVFHGHSPWLSSIPAPQIGEVKYLPWLQVWFAKKKLPCLMLNLFLQTFTGQRQATPSTARSNACSLQWRWQAGQTICVGSSPYCPYHLMHSWRSSIKQAPILTKDILSKIAWSGASETAMMTEYIENDITKWKSIFSWSIENNLNTQTRVNKSTYLKTALRNQVFSYDQDELLTDDGRLNKIRELWRRITSFLLILRPKFLYDS